MKQTLLSSKDTKEIPIKLEPINKHRILIFHALLSLNVKMVRETI